MAHLFEVKHATVVDPLGRKRTGWIVFEDGMPGYPFDTKDKAIRQAHAIAAMRVVNGQTAPVRVTDSE